MKVEDAIRRQMKKYTYNVGETVRLDPQFISENSIDEFPQIIQVQNHKWEWFPSFIGVAYLLVKKGE